MKAKTTIPVLLTAILTTLFSVNASATDDTPKTDPHWNFEIKGGYFFPDLPDYETFYGDDKDFYFALASSYRFRNWLEFGGEIGHMSDSGVGIQPGSGQLGGKVRYTLIPVHAFVNFMYQRNYSQWLVPYIGAGLSVAYYNQDIDQQPDRNGLTDVGGMARAGIRLFVNPLDPSTAARASKGVLQRSYLFLEAQYFTTEVDNTDLGGKVYLLGFRLEFGD